MPAESFWLKLEIASRFSGVLFTALNVILVSGLVAANRVFRDELTAVDRLMSEYVRFRDLLLSARKPEGGVGGLRLLGDDAFREAWRNFNQQLDSIRTRYRDRAARFKALFIAVAVVALLSALLWGVGAGESRRDWRLVVMTAGAFLATAGLWTAALIQVRQNGRLMRERTSGSYLLAPWPSDGGTPDRQFSLLGKFLPVEVTHTPVEAASEVPPSV